MSRKEFNNYTDVIGIIMGGSQEEPWYITTMVLILGGNS